MALMNIDDSGFWCRVRRRPAAPMMRQPAGAEAGAKDLPIIPSHVLEIARNKSRIIDPAPGPVPIQIGQASNWRPITGWSSDPFGPVAPFPPPPPR